MDADAIALWSLIVAVVTLIVGVFVSVVLFQLGGRVDFRSRMRRADELRDELNRLFIQPRDELHDVILMNARRYEKDYDGGNNANRHGFIMGKSELLGPRHNGVELIDAVSATWTDGKGRRTLRKPGKRAKGWTKAQNVFEVGLVPWEYIEHINLHGDEYRNEVIFYVRYKGPGKQPFRSYTYVETAGKHIGPSGRLYFDPVDDLGEYRPNRLLAWIRFQKTRFTQWRMDRASRRRMRELRQLRVTPLGMGRGAVAVVIRALPGGSPSRRHQGQRRVAEQGRTPRCRGHQAGAGGLLGPTRH